MDNCIECSGYKDKDGYGFVWYNSKQWRAHRLAYFLEFGEFNQSLLVLHKCDNPACINPKHLFLGTQQDNILDRVSKNRSNRNPKVWGETHPNAKLTQAQVDSIKSSSKRQKELAQIYNVNFRTIHAIKSGKNWGTI